MFQRTIKKEVIFEGFGIYFKEKVLLKCYPAETDTGIIINNKKLLTDNITIENHTTVFNNNGNKIFLIEHFLAVLFLLGIDNLIIELFGKEFPFLDGSGKEYYLKLKNLVVDLYPYKKKVIEIKKSLLVFDNNNFILLLPNEEFSCLVIANFPNYFSWQIFKLNNNFSHIIFSQTPISKEILKEEDISLLRDLGYYYYHNWFIGKGQFVCHKIFDLLGNLKILNREIKGKIIAFRPSHKLNLKLVRKLEKLN
ncbi:MAG: UDP-3-O-acyl-N-acetylglucosamine deacetylase [candidate division WOR-3 bacterium]|nr:UDP-3-O-acyl-N-acetylglucosamine deacetylase [candidate division WOR-3 bacterium]MCX7836629.1 UDP-3-O-acyl-N-acetylglucosamine deacetylase [candidate division WOR-3 bacterium]MDW8113323.1 UDP-3-O-acyl-N-acetylglucosamine deacetylase [candidate division WOR-3 bacterium]